MEFLGRYTRKMAKDGPNHHQEIEMIMTKRLQELGMYEEGMTFKEKEEIIKALEMSEATFTQEMERTVGNEQAVEDLEIEKLGNKSLGSDHSEIKDEEMNTDLVVQNNIVDNKVEIEISVESMDVVTKPTMCEEKSPASDEVDKSLSRSPDIFCHNSPVIVVESQEELENGETPDFLPIDQKNSVHNLDDEIGGKENVDKASEVAKIDDKLGEERIDNHETSSVSSDGVICGSDDNIGCETLPSRRFNTARFRRSGNLVLSDDDNDDNSCEYPEFNETCRRDLVVFEKSSEFVDKSFMFDPSMCSTHFRLPICQNHKVTVKRYTRTFKEYVNKYLKYLVNYQRKMMERKKWGSVVDIQETINYGRGTSSENYYLRSRNKRKYYSSDSETMDEDVIDDALVSKREKVAEEIRKYGSKMSLDSQDRSSTSEQFNNQAAAVAGEQEVDGDKNKEAELLNNYYGGGGADDEFGDNVNETLHVNPKIKPKKIKVCKSVSENSDELFVKYKPVTGCELGAEVEVEGGCLSDKKDAGLSHPMKDYEKKRENGEIRYMPKRRKGYSDYLLSTKNNFDESSSHDGNKESKTVCPICNRLFPMSKIEHHASLCGESDSEDIIVMEES